MAKHHPYGIEFINSTAELPPASPARTHGHDHLVAFPPDSPEDPRNWPIWRVSRPRGPPSTRRSPERVDLIEMDDCGKHRTSGSQRVVGRQRLLTRQQALRQSIRRLERSHHSRPQSLCARPSSWPHGPRTIV